MGFVLLGMHHLYTGYLTVPGGGYNYSTGNFKYLIAGVLIGIGAVIIAAEVKRIKS